MGSALIKHFGGRAKPESRENRAQFQASAEVPEQSTLGLYQGRRRRAIVNDKNNTIVMSNVSRNQLYVRVVEEGENKCTLVPDNRGRDGVIKINDNQELTFSDDPDDEDEGVKFETSLCERGDCLKLTLIDSEVQGKLHVRPNDNVLVVDGEEYTGFQIRHPY